MNDGGKKQREGRFQRSQALFCPPAEAGYRCIPSALQLLKEVVTSYTPEEQNQHQESPEDPSAVILGVVANLFQKVIELLARRLRKQPEEGRQVFKLYLLAVL